MYVIQIYNQLQSLFIDQSKQEIIQNDSNQQIQINYQNILSIFSLLQNFKNNKQLHNQAKQIFRKFNSSKTIPMTQQQQKNKKKLPPTILLPNKQQLPLIGLGTYKIQDQQTLLTLLRKGIEIGLRHIDTARLYNNEIPLGNAINQVIKQGRCKRQDLFIATKTFPHKNLNPVLQLKQALRLMNLKYVDVYYMHWPLIDMDPQGKNWNHRPLEQFWKDMEQCVRKGYTKHIAVSNFNGQLLADLLTFCKIKPIINQIQTHPYLPQLTLVEFCQKNGIAVVAHTCLARADSCTKQDVNILKQQLINDVATKHGKTPAQVVLKFSLTRNIGIIPKTSHLNRLIQNFESWTVELTDDQMKKLKNIQKNVRICDGRANFFKYFSAFD